MKEEFDDKWKPMFPTLVSMIGGNMIISFFKQKRNCEYFLFCFFHVYNLKKKQLAMPSILYEDDLIDFTIIDLCKQYWHITYIYKNNPDLIFFFFNQITRNGV